MNHLYRELAPIGEDGWTAIEAEARQRLTTYLAARKLVDLAGPHGWTYSATDLGRANPPVGDRTQVRQRRVLPLLELRVPFTVSREEVDSAERGAADLDWGGLEAAAQEIGLTENSWVFHGNAAGGIVGISEASSHAAIPLGADYSSYPTHVAKAVNALREVGIGGPYGLAIDPGGYTGIVETTEHGGYLLFDHLRHILGGPVVWSPGVEGALVLSLRGGDFQIDSGQDISIGYLDHDATTVSLYFEESLSFRVLEPDAAVALVR